jgi:hypothetical protein
VNHAGSQEVDRQEEVGEEVDRCQEGRGHQGEEVGEEVDRCQEGRGHQGEEVDSQEVGEEALGRNDNALR